MKAQEKVLITFGYTQYEQHVWIAVQTVPTYACEESADTCATRPEKNIVIVIVLQSEHDYENIGPSISGIVKGCEEFHKALLKAL